MKLSEKDISQYQADGFLVVSADRLLLPNEVREIIAEVDVIQQWPESEDKWMIYLDELQDGTTRLNRIENIIPYSKHFADLFSSSRLGGAVAQLAGAPVVVFKEKINFKQPGGDGFEPHQDAQAGWDGYGHSFHISVAIAIDECTSENGCLEFVRGFHNKGLLGPEGEAIPEDVTKSLKWESVLAKPGDVIFFDSYAPHRSGPNRTTGQRRLIYLTYNLEREGDFREDYYVDKKKSYPPNILRSPHITYGYKI